MDNSNLDLTRAAISERAMQASPGSHHAAPAIRQVDGWDLLQFGGWESDWTQACAVVAQTLGCVLPECVGQYTDGGSIRVMRVAAHRFWVYAAIGDARQGALRAMAGSPLGVITELGHSRLLFRIEGAGARSLMSVLMPIDFDETIFAARSFAQSQIHHVPVLVATVAGEENEAFDLYVPRTFARSIREWIVGRGAIDVDASTAE